MGIRKWSVLSLIGFAFAARAEIQIASNLLVRLDVSVLAGTGDGAKISSWTNSGALGGTFIPIVNGQGPVYQANVLGGPAVTFAASTNSVMTNTVLPSAALLGTGTVWSVELWVLNPTLQSPEGQFAWTDRGSWTGSADGTCMEIRYGSDAANAVEHNNSTCNIPWSGNPPLAGAWHHIAIARSADGSERLYADGVLRTTKTPPVSNLRSGAPFALGGVWDRSTPSWQTLFSGSLAAVRVHSGTLTAAQVLANFLNDQATYQAVWSGTPDVSGAWSDSGNWLGGNVAGNGETAWITNGGLAVLSGSLALNHLYPDCGGLTVTNGATLSLGAQDSVNLANAGRAFTLVLADGAFKLPGANTISLLMGNGGGDATVAVGGTGASALLEVDRDTVLANSSGSAGAMTVGAGGSVFNSNGSFIVASALGAQGQMTVNGGAVGFRTADKDFVVNTNGARGAVTVNGGLIRATGSFKWSASLSTNAACGEVRLNGGTLEAKRFFADTVAGTNLLYLNGGTVKAYDSRTNFLERLTGAYVQLGGAVFEVPSNVTVTAAQGLLEDPSSQGGGVTKLGPGVITFSGANTFTGPIDVRAGSLFFSQANGLVSGYSGVVSVTNEGSVGYNAVNGATLLAGKLTAGSSGYLTLFSNNAADSVDFSALPNMKLALPGLASYTGTVTPYQGQYAFKVEGSIVTNGAVLADDGATRGHLSVTGVSGGGMALTNSNTFTGGAEIDGATVVFAHTNALGFQATAGVQDVRLRNGAALVLSAAMDIAAFVTSRLTTDSSGILLIGPANAARNIDLSSHPGIVVGSAELSLDYTGTLTPSAALSAFRLGGGNTPYSGTPNRGFSVNTLADYGGATKAVIGTPGLVELKSGNTHSGGTVVTNRGVLFLKEDGLGAVPTVAQPGNLTVDNGVIRSGNASFTVHTNRGVTVGSGGLELHPWGGYTMTVAGNLSGSGKITVTDNGWVTFGGAANTYSGLFEIPASRNIRIGTGPNFSWSSSGSFALNGTLALKTDGSSSFSSPISGSGSPRKEGSGALTLSGAQTYSGVTYVDAGVLKVAATNVLPRGAGKGVVEIAAGARLDSNGGDLLAGGLQGVGTVTNGTAVPGALYVGETSVDTMFGGTIDPSLTLVKIGAGRQSLSNAVGAAGSAEIRAGALDLWGSAAVTGTVTLAGGTLGVTYGTSGLLGNYYALTAAPATNDFVSYAAVTNFLKGKTPSVVSNSLGFGTTFNTLLSSSATPNRFPAPFNADNTNNFVAFWEGFFAAPKTGTYGFATASDDGSVVFIGGQKVLDNNAMQSYDGNDSNVVGTVTLEAGLHPIAIAFYEGTGNQGLTVWVRQPGSSGLGELSNAQLFTGFNAGQALVGTLAGNLGAVSFADKGLPTLRIAGTNAMSYGGEIVGVNPLSRLVKQGSGTLTLSSGKSDFYGTLDVQSGVLSLTNGASALGTLQMSAGAATVVGAAYSGLRMDFYNRSTSDASYTKFQTLDLFNDYLRSTFPAGPHYVTNSLVLGTTLNTGAGGEYWPAPYKQSGGAEGDTYDLYMYGNIFLDRSGTYVFSTGSDDGSMLFIDRQLVVNNGYDQGVIVRSGTNTLTAGYHRIDIFYRENTGGNALQVYIGYPGQATAMMPQSILSAATLFRGLVGEAGSALSLGTNAVVIVSQDTNTEYAGTLAGDGTTAFKKGGSGTLTLTGDSAGFSGLVQIGGGTIQIGAGGGAGSLGTRASFSVDAAGTLVFDRAGTVTVGGALSGSGLIVLNGPGEFYVTSTNAFTGKVQINNGRLTFAPGATLGASAVVTNAAAVEIETSSTNAQGGVMGTLAGSGDLVVSGSGMLILNNSNTNFSGVTHITNSAAVRVTKPINLSSGGEVALEGGTLAVLPDVQQGTNLLMATLADTNAWKRNGSAAWVTRNSAPWLQITPNTGSQAGSCFYTNAFSPQAPWYAAFRYEVGGTSANAADGMTFILQNDSRGLAALGASGGGLGACKDGANGTPISPSIGLFFNLYNADSVGWIVDGVRVDTVTAINGINLTNGVDVAFVYDGVALKITLTQGTQIYTATRTVDLASKFGSGTKVYAGFSGGTGGETAQQFIGNFSMYDAVPTQTDFSGNTLRVATGLTGTLAPTVVNSDTTFNFGTVALGSNALLNVSAGYGSRVDAGYAVAMSNVMVAAGVGTVTVAANGSGRGVLALKKLTFGSGAKLVVTGAVSVPGGVLTVVVPTPVPSGITYLADFTGATWVGGLPTLVLVDTNGNSVDEHLFLRNGKLYINTLLGTLLQIK